MKRRLLIFATIITFAIFVAAAVLWVRSYWVNDTIVLKTMRDSQTGTVRWISSSHGTVCFRMLSDGLLSPKEAGIGYWPLKPESLWEEHEFIGFGYHYDAMTFPPFSPVDAGARVPWWFLLLLASLLPLRMLLRRRKRSDDVWRCVHCGYDIRATPERCPECGRLVVPGRPAAA